jgi:hypothetical protein
MTEEKINHDPRKGVIWMDKEGNIVAEADAFWGEIWIDEISHIVIPEKSKVEKTKTANNKTTVDGKKKNQQK